MKPVQETISQHFHPEALGLAAQKVFCVWHSWMATPYRLLEFRIYTETLVSRR